MDRDYEVYCLVDPIFYDSPLRASWDNKEFTAAKSVPGGWARHDFEDWRALQPVGVELPKQGWKVHVSACLSNADAILSAVWEYCVPRRIPFKFIRNQPLLLLRNAKNASRAASGKFVTIYPANEAQLDAVCRELGEALAGQEGPYILSDLRLGAGPLFVRYGGFAERWCVGPGGEQVLAIEDSGGALVPDRRTPTFQPPAWVTLPPFLEPHLAARNGATVDEFPFHITAALHFSNAGGVYAGVERDTGRPLVIKEARPHAGLTFDGADAVARLVRERDILGKLAGLACVPAVRGFFQVGEHHFLAIDRIEAKPLRRLIVARYPLILPEAGAAEVAAYTDWAVSMYRQVEEAVSSVHRRGVVIGDLHPYNILVRSDGSVALIDFEVAAEASERRRPALGAPGFGARGAEGFDIDRYALASLALFFFLPLTALVSLDPAKATQLADEIEDLFPTPAGFLSEA
ncbi:MAG TPA: class III lanthionine synthetase LanKC, partial [Actinomycetota bacterium]|nr:class III lanthionine synthetase LanKC [Actinomycetota bacterium]